MVLRRRSKIITSDCFWITAQLALFGCSAAAGIRQLRRQGHAPDRGTLALAALPFAAALGIAEQARRRLGDNLKMAPTPVPDGHLVTSGVYGVVRHPMYLSVILGMLAWAMAVNARASWLAVPTATIFFNAKARHEERLLVNRYPAYDAYRQAVRGRILPRCRRDQRTS